MEIDRFLQMAGRTTKTLVIATTQTLHTRISSPWIYVGDYNEILSSKEKQGGIPKLLNLMEAFRATFCIADSSTMVFKVTFSLGTMVDMRMHLYRNGLIEHVQRQNGRKSFWKLGCLISKHHTWTMF